MYDYPESTDTPDGWIMLAICLGIAAVIVVIRDYLMQHILILMTVAMITGWVFYFLTWSKLKKTELENQAIQRKLDQCTDGDTYV
jgi:Flp pilus assembly protein TadB